MTMTRKEYQKPFMAVERFVANEFVAACWYAESDDFYTELYQDKYTYTKHGNYGSYNNIWHAGDEDLDPPSAPSRLPSVGNIKNSEPVKIQDTSSDGNRYYTNYNPLLSFQPLQYTSQVTEIYTYTYSGTTYYLKSFTNLGGNHS